MRSLVAVDPGLNSMGWAYWRYPDVHTRPTRAGLLHAPKRLDLPKRAHWLAINLGTIVRRLGTYDVVSEFPAWHGTSMAWAAGDLQKLCFLVGVLAGSLPYHTFTICTPAEWKGQLPKGAVIRRLRRIIGRKHTQDFDKDMWDAVGIGLWKMGRF